MSHGFLGPTLSPALLFTEACFHDARPPGVSVYRFYPTSVVAKRSSPKSWWRPETSGTLKRARKTLGALRRFPNEAMPPLLFSGPVPLMSASGSSGPPPAPGLAQRKPGCAMKAKTTE